MTVNECVKEIKDIIDKKIQMKAIFVSGDWGIGKTKGIKDAFPNSIYLSLYGVNTEHELYERFEQELFDFELLNNEENKKKLQIGKGVLDEVNKLDIKNNCWIKNIIPALKIFTNGINILNGITKFYVLSKDISNKVVIIDDIERSNIDLNVVEGFIDYILNKRKVKLILIGNEKKFLGKTNNNVVENESKNELSEFKDKLCDYFFIINDIDFDVIKKILDIDYDRIVNILEYIKINQINNLRIIEKTEYLYEYVLLKVDINLLNDTMKKIMKLVILDIINEEINNKNIHSNNQIDDTNIKSTDNLDLIHNLVVMHSKEFSNFIVPEYYISDSMFKELSGKIKDLIINGNTNNVRMINECLKQIKNEFNNKPYRHMTNEELENFVKNYKNIKLSEPQELSTYLHSIDRIIEYYNLLEIDIDENIIQDFNKNIENNAKSIVDYLMSFNIDYNALIGGLFEFIDNKKLLQPIFERIINNQIKTNLDNHINIINNSNNYNEVGDSIIAIINLIKSFDIDIRKKESLRTMSFDIPDMCFDNTKEKVLRDKFNFLYEYNTEYISKCMVELQNKDFTNISAKLIYKNILRIYEKLENERKNNT